MIADVAKILAEYELDVAGAGRARGPYRPIRVVYHEGVAAVDLMWVPKLTLSALGQSQIAPQTNPVLVVGPRITERSAQPLRALGVNYLDYSGNLHLRLPGLRLDVRGRSGADTRGNLILREAPRGGSRNLFSRRRAQVIFAILSWPELLERGQRVIAAAAGVALGQVNTTLRLLIEDGYLLPGKRLTLWRADELYERWVASYPLGLGQVATELRLSGDREKISPQGGTAVAISGESATSLIRNPETLTLYVDPVSTAFIRGHRWHKSDSPTIFIRPKFWQDPRDPTQGKGVVQAAPPLLVYADLFATREGRQREVARVLGEPIHERLRKM